MTRFTVICRPKAEAELAQLWLDANDRGRIANAADSIEHELRKDADAKGDATREGFRRLIVPPLSALFTVSEEDRKAIIWSFNLLAD